MNGKRRKHFLQKETEDNEEQPKTRCFSTTATARGSQRGSEGSVPDAEKEPNSLPLARQPAKNAPDFGALVKKMPLRAGSEFCVALNIFKSGAPL
jgi:hypothetical protein